MEQKAQNGHQRCRIILKHCLAIQLSRPGHTPEDFWMYDSGYMIFQNFLAANSQCWWNTPLTAATRALSYAGHVAPGMLLVTAEPCALEVLRGAYARSVLKPPATYVINSVGDIDDCIVTPITQGQFTPLPEALCDIIMDLTLQGLSATVENIKVNLNTQFPHMQTPSCELIYDTLAQLMQERKIYQTSKGYFIVTPERRRSRSGPKGYRVLDSAYEDVEPQESRTVLLTNSEALHSLYGEISTERDGDLTHQCIQTNLADVICGGNPNDKIMYARSSKRRSASFPTPRSLERRHSLRLFGSSKRLQRCVSSRSLSKNYAQTFTTDSSSSECHSTDSSSIKKVSLLSRLFRRSGRNTNKQSRQIETFSAQFPPAEWFNSRAVHLHSVGTQTNDHDATAAHTLSNSTFYDASDISQRSLTLPRRHHRRHLSSESTFLISSRDCSPIRHRPSAYSSGSLPRSTHSIPATTKQLKAIHHHHQQQIGQQQSKLGTGNLSSHSQEIDNKIMNERNNNKSFSNGGKSSSTMGMVTTSASGPSSIESGKTTASSRGSDRSSSRNSNRYLILNSSPTRPPSYPSPIMAKRSENSMKIKTNYINQGNSMKRKENQSSPATISMGNNSIPSSTATTTTASSTRTTVASDVPQNNISGIPNSTSNSSITLQVTTSSNSSNSNSLPLVPRTKIYVQNSPVRSVITLENPKIMENSNVFIINNETITNANGESISRNITTGSNKHHHSLHHHYNKENVINEYDANSETGDSVSLISDTSPDSSMTPIINSRELLVTDFVENMKFTKNINNDAKMNNSRKSSLQLSQTQANNFDPSGGSLVYKNVLKNNETSNPSSPINKKNSFTFENGSSNNCRENYNQIAGSVGNLRLADKNSSEFIISKNLQHLDTTTIDGSDHQHQNSSNLLKKITLNSNPAINTDSLAHILHKNIITVGSEPNLAIKNTEMRHQQLNNKIPDKLINEKESLLMANDHLNQRHQRHYYFPPATLTSSASTTTMASLKQNDGITLPEEIYNFPSLTDLSHNFTSLTAQKLLHGVSINSVDTLVELNMANNQQQQQDMTKPNNILPYCTDYGKV